MDGAYLVEQSMGASPNAGVSGMEVTPGNNNDQPNAGRLHPPGKTP